ncbi:receptor expression-enhancing protein 6 isoform 1-T1 [Chlamydotis macqueenii]
MGTVPQRLQRLLDRPGPLGDLLSRLEARTGVRRLYLASGSAAFLSLYLVFGYGASLLCNLIGFAYPAYVSACSWCGAWPPCPGTGHGCSTRTSSGPASSGTTRPWTACWATSARKPWTRLPASPEKSCRLWSAAEPGWRLRWHHSSACLLQSSPEPGARSEEQVRDIRYHDPGPGPRLAVLAKPGPGPTAAAPNKPPGLTPSVFPE